MRLTHLIPALAIVVATPAAAQVMAPADYVKTAGAGDLYERTSSELVLQTTRDPQIRELARTMIAHHAKSTADVTAAARRAGIAVAPPRLNAEQTERVAQLRAANGTARDTAYIAQQKVAHDEALAAHRAYATNGTAQPLRAAATAIVPVVESHIAMLGRM